MDASADSLLPAPADLWPKVPAAEAVHRSDALLTVQVPLFSVRLLLRTLSLSVESEMASAGRWAAQGGDRPNQGTRRRRLARQAARGFANQAARLLALYAAIYPRVRHGMTALLPSPEGLRAEATLAYRREFQAVRRSQALTTTPFNDALFADLQKEMRGHGLRPHR